MPKIRVTPPGTSGLKKEPCPKIQAQVKTLPAERCAARIRQLTPRQQEILPLLANGASDEQIARALGCSWNTMKCHVHNIRICLGVNNRVQAAVFYERSRALLEEATL